MRRWNPVLSLSLLLLSLSMAGSPASRAQSEVTTYTPSRVRWKQLVFRASKLGVKADSEIDIRFLPTAEVSKRLITAEASTDAGAPVEPKGSEVVEVVVRTQVKGTESTTTLLLEPTTAAAYQRAQHFVGKNDKQGSFLRTYRYLQNGVFVERRKAPAGDASGSPSGWPVSDTRMIPFPSGVSGGGVTEAMALFYILSAADFAKVGDRLRFLSFDKPEVSEVVMTVEEMVPWKVSYTEVSPSGERKIEAQHQVARLTISGKSVGEGEGAFEFLGLRGNIEIFADPELRIPVAARGKVPVVGKTTIGVAKVVIE